MPKLPSLEDYIAPWESRGGADAEIDKPKLKKYIHGLLSDKEKLQSTVTEVTTERDTLQKAAEDKAREGESEVDRLKRENEELRAAQGKDSGLAVENLKLKVALDKGLTSTQAKRLVGTTEEELAKDAEELLESFGGKADNDGGEARRRPQRRANPTDPDPDGDAEVNIEKAIASIPRIN